MATATVTSKGQITLPKSVRDELGIETGDQVVFVVEGKGVALHAVPKSRLTELRGIAKGHRPYAGRDAERSAARDEAVRNSVPAHRTSRGR